MLSIPLTTTAAWTRLIGDLVEHGGETGRVLECRGGFTQNHLCKRRTKLNHKQTLIKADKTNSKK